MFPLVFKPANWEDRIYSGLVIDKIGIQVFSFDPRLFLSPVTFWSVRLYHSGLFACNSGKLPLGRQWKVTF